MKIDFELLEKMVDAGASGAVVLAYLKDQHGRNEKRREADRMRKTTENKRNPSENLGIPRNSARFRKLSANDPASMDEAAWDQVLATYKTVGKWSRHAGPDPESPSCRCPPALLEKHGIKLPAGVQ